MTTIVYKDGIIAYDTRCGAGTSIVSDNYDKKYVVDDKVFFIAGYTSQIPTIIETYPDKDVEDEIYFSAFVVEGETVYMYCSDGDGVAHKHLISGTHNCYAIGSGCDHAYTAMDYGASAKEAVKAAMKRDMRTGGRVRLYKVGK